MPYCKWTMIWYGVGVIQLVKYIIYRFDVWCMSVCRFKFLMLNIILYKLVLTF